MLSGGHNFRVNWGGVDKWQRSKKESSPALLREKKKERKKDCKHLFLSLFFLAKTGSLFSSIFSPLGGMARRKRSYKIICQSPLLLRQWKVNNRQYLQFLEPPMASFYFCKCLIDTPDRWRRYLWEPLYRATSLFSPLPAKLQFATDATTPPSFYYYYCTPSPPPPHKRGGSKNAKKIPFLSPPPHCNKLNSPAVSCLHGWRRCWSSNWTVVVIPRSQCTFQTSLQIFRELQ